MTKLLYQGHASFRLTTDGGSVVYIDPFARVGLEAPADIVLITHEHHDHNNVDLLTLSEGCLVVRSSDMLANGKHLTKDLGPIVVEATPACNGNHPIDSCIGFLIYVDGLTLYFAGDTSKIDYMSTVLPGKNIDYAFLPCDGVYNMDRPEAEECARAIGAKHTVPIHTAPSASGDECAFDAAKAEAFEAPGKIVIRPGEEITL